jgi:bifunctional DNA-binding transcriptional regulator/antitoxin component of YhaV-PrlF toxin-antitoxin module
MYSAKREVKNMESTTVQMAKRGVITIPQPLRETYGMQPGDMFTLMDLGGVLVLSPRLSEIDVLAERMRTQWTEKGDTLETMLEALREERDRRGR